MVHIVGFVGSTQTRYTFHICLQTANAIKRLIIEVSSRIVLASSRKLEIYGLHAYKNHIMLGTNKSFHLFSKVLCRIVKIITPLAVNEIYKFSANRKWVKGRVEVCSSEKQSVVKLWDHLHLTDICLGYN